MKLVLFGGSAIGLLSIGAALAVQTQNPWLLVGGLAIAAVPGYIAYRSRNG